MHTIAELRQEVKRIPTPQQILTIQQALNNFGFSLTTRSGKPSEPYEPGFEENAKQLLQMVEMDKSHNYECDWNWYVNAKNIPNQEAVFATKEFLEQERKHWIASIHCFVRSKVASPSDKID